MRNTCVAQNPIIVQPGHFSNRAGDEIGWQVACDMRLCSTLSDDNAPTHCFHNDHSTRTEQLR